MLPVSFGQWDRLKGRVATLGNARVDYTNYVVGAWGVCIPCGISFVIYALESTNRPEWALPLYGIGGVASGTVALLLRKFQRAEASIRTADASDIVGEMDTIEEAFLRGEGASR
jgi:hypothetical protein